MSTFAHAAYRITSLLVVLALLLAALGCDSAAPTVLPAAATDLPARAASPTLEPLLTPRTEGARPTPRPPCTASTPEYYGELALTSLPGTLRQPSDLVFLGKQLIVSSRTSRSLGVIESDKLSQIFPLNAAPGQIAADQQSGQLYIVNESERTISQFANTQVRASLTISNPRLAGYQTFGGMALDAERGRLYVMVTGEGSAIAVVDTRAFTLTRWIDLPGWRTGTRMRMDAGGQSLIIAGYDRIEVLDLALGIVVKSIPLPTSSYSVFALDAQTGRMFVDQYDNGAYVGVIEKDQVVARIPVGADAVRALAVGRQLYVSSAYSSTVSVIDIDSLRTLATIPVGSRPGALAADPQGERVYVAVQGNYGHEINRIEVIDTRTLAVSHLIPLMAQPSQLTADARRSRLYALMPSSSELLVTDGQRVLASVPLGRSPAQMALDEPRGRLYVSDWESSDVTVVDVVNWRVLERRPLTQPRQTAIAVDPFHDRLIVSNRLYALDTLAPAGAYTLTGFTIQTGSIAPDSLAASAAQPRIAAIAGNGVPGSNGGLILYMVDSGTLRQSATSFERNIAGIAIDDTGGTIYAAANHPMTGESKVMAFRSDTLTVSVSLPMPTTISAVAFAPQTRHLFVAYRDMRTRPPYNPTANQVEVIDTRTFGRVAVIPVAAEPNALAVFLDRLYVAHATGRSLSIIRDCTAPAPAAPTATPSPTPYPTLPPPPSPTVAPAVTPPIAAPRATVAPTPLPSPTRVAACRLPPAPWARATGTQSFDLQANLGCPVETARPVGLASQSFQNGRMFWRADTRSIYVINNNGMWAAYEDTWDAGQPEGGTEKPPLPNLRAPKRGFGKVWREQLGGPAASLGWATGEEQSVGGEIQAYERGQGLREGMGAVYLLMNNGSWY